MRYFVYCRKSQEAEDRQVMSLEAQTDEIERAFGNDADIEIVDHYEEAFSAKQPGRPIFNEMMERIERGEAEGIIAWHPDRLARNSVDGGRIIYLLDQGVLKGLRFCSYNFENSSEGKFMLTVIFGYSKYTVDNLSENVKRGNRIKLKNGWLPNLAPTGYRNCKETSTIVVDQPHFDAIRRMFALLLSGNYTVPEIHRIVCEQWGYLTPIIKTRGGKRLSRAGLYHILSNPFYAGYIRWNGHLYEGSHTPVVSKSEFEKAQRILGRNGPTRPQQLSFPYRGLFTCGACGLAVTAERKRKPSGRTYVYYHCTRMHRTPKCRQPSIEARALDRQVDDFLDRITIPQSVTDWLREHMQSAQQGIADARHAVTQKLAAQVESVKRQLSNLTDLRVRELVSDNEFEAKRETLQRELGKTEERAAEAENNKSTFEPLLILQILCNRARFWFTQADDATKRGILKILCSNPTLTDKKALFEAKKPFRDIVQIADCLNLLADVDDVRRTPDCAASAQNGVLLADVDDVRMAPDCADSAQNGVLLADVDDVRRIPDCAADAQSRALTQLEALVVEPDVIALAEEVRQLIEQIEPEALAPLARQHPSSPPKRTAVRRAPADHWP